MSHRRYAAMLLTLVVLAAIFIGSRDFVGMLRSCGGKGYAADTFLAGCESNYFGNYEHGAYYFELEPEAVAALKSATVVVLGHSRPMFAFGTQSWREFFNSRAIKYYLFGFRFAEGERFAQSLLNRLHVRPKVLILTVDNYFFTGYQSVEAMGIEARRSHYVYKKLEQVAHRWVCSAWSRSASDVICPDKSSLFRSRSTGEWDFSRFHGKNASGHAFQYDYSVAPDLLAKQLQWGGRFLEGLDVRPECIVLTTVPYPDAHLGTTLELAKELGVRAVLPHVEGLATWDDSHLSADSAEAYSRAFGAEVEGIVRTCTLNAPRDAK